MNKKNFEKKIKTIVNSKGDFSSIMKVVDKDYQRKNVYKTKQTKIVKFIPLITVGSLVVQAAAILLFVSLTNNSIWNRVSSHNYNENSDVTSSSNPVPSSHENLKTYRNYRWFDYGSKKYQCSNKDFDYINQNLIKKQIGELDIEQTDTSEGITGKKHIVIHELSKIDSELGIAVKFEEESGYFLYTSSSLEHGSTLNSLLVGMNFEENAFYSLLSYSYEESGGSIKTISTENIGSSVTDLLNSNLTKTNIYSSDETSPYNSFSTQISAQIILQPLGNIVSSLDINLDGRSRFSIVGGNTFVIEPEDVLYLKTYIENIGK